MGDGIYSNNLTGVAHHAISAEASSILQVRGKSPTGGTNNLMLESLNVAKGHLIRQKRSETISVQLAACLLMQQLQQI